MQPLEAHRAMPEERPPGTGPEPSLGELPGDDQRLAAEGKDLGGARLAELLLRYVNMRKTGCSTSSYADS